MEENSVIHLDWSQAEPHKDAGVLLPKQHPSLQDRRAVVHWSSARLHWCGCTYSAQTLLSTHV